MERVSCPTEHEPEHVDALDYELPEEDLDRPESEVRCPECYHWVATEDYGRTEDLKFFILSCSECGNTRVRPTAHGMMCRVIDDGEDPEKVFKERFPDEVVESMDFSGMEDTHRIQTEMKSDEAVSVRLESGEEKDLTDLLIDDSEE